MIPFTSEYMKGVVALKLTSRGEEDMLEDEQFSLGVEVACAILADQMERIETKAERYRLQREAFAKTCSLIDDGMDLEQAFEILATDLEELKNG